LLAIGADAVLTYFRWLLARRIEAEANGTAWPWPRYPPSRWHGH
jgi:hypothetical protein